MESVSSGSASFLSVIDVGTISEVSCARARAWWPQGANLITKDFTNKANNKVYIIINAAILKNN
jgi:hypothetical protein